MKPFSTHDLSWALRSSQKSSCMLTHVHPQALVSMVLWCYEHSWVLMSAQSLMAPCSWLLLSSHECSLLYGAKLMSVYGCSWVFNGNQEHSWLLLAAYECSWGLLGAYECSWLLISSTHEKPWAWCHGAMSTHESSRAVMSMAPWGSERSSALMSAHSTILTSAFGCTWAHMSSFGSSWALTRGHEC